MQEDTMTSDEPRRDGSSSYQLIQNDGVSYAVMAERTTVLNFVIMSILFSANHGCVVACLALATAQLGSLGAWQSGILYLTYTASALLGATYLVKRAGARNALMTGMFLYCIYVACFWIATKWVQQATFMALFGAGIGGIGAGCLWTAQGAYFSMAAEEHARHKQTQHYQQVDAVPSNQIIEESFISESTSYLAGIFAFLYLAEEVVLRLLSTALLQFKLASWGTIFALYTIISIASTLGMIVVRNYSSSSDSSPMIDENGERNVTNDGDDEHDDTHRMDASSATGDPSSTESESASVIWYKITAAARLLWDDPKMKYMIGLNALFGLTSAFLNSYVNGQVVPAALESHDAEGNGSIEDGAKYIGVLTSWVSMVAAVMSLVLGRVSNIYGKAPVLILGSFCFIGVVLPFVLYPPNTYFDSANLEASSSPWGWTLLILVYTLHGTGRATFESTLKATFADYFPQEKEGAFANIILQNGLSGAIGYVLTFALTCEGNGDSTRWGCVRYSDGSHHDVGTFESLCLVAGVFAVFGLVKASAIYREEKDRQRFLVGSPNAADGDLEDETALVANQHGVST